MDEEKQVKVLTVRLNGSFECLSITHIETSPAASQDLDYS